GGAVRGAEDARTGRRKPAPGGRALGREAGGDVRGRGGELGRTDDDVEPLWREDEVAHRVARDEPLDVEPVMALLGRVGRLGPASVDSDERDPRPQRARELEAALERPLPRFLAERREQRDLALPLVADADDRR